LENTNLRKDNTNMKEELTRLREQLSYIRVASQERRRPPPLDLANLPEYHTSERRPSMGRVSGADRISAAVGGSSSLDSIELSSEK
jgi:hypothetical protein